MCELVCESETGDNSELGCVSVPPPGSNFVRIWIMVSMCLFKKPAKY